MIQRFLSLLPPEVLQYGEAVDDALPDAFSQLPVAAFPIFSARTANAPMLRRPTARRRPLLRGRGRSC